MSDLLSDMAEAVPPRSLLASLPGPVWGVDPSVERISLGILSPATGSEPARIESHTLSLAQGGAHAGVRLGRAMPALQAWFVQLARLDWPSADGGAPRRVPVALAVEEPFGGAKTQTPVPSYMLCGVILAATWATFGDRTEVLRQKHKSKEQWSHIGVGPTSWKARAMGAGNGFAKKPAISAWAERACGWEGVSATRPQDEADALGVATWAAMELLGR